MLLSKKKDQSTRTEWAVILSKPRNELARRRAAEAMVQAFRVASDEAQALVASVPIILLDRLPMETAEQVRNYFQTSSVTCFITNDTFAKRKCYRAVWPSEPSLTPFLEGGTTRGRESSALEEFLGVREETDSVPETIAPPPPHEEAMPQAPYEGPPAPQAPRRETEEPRPAFEEGRLESVVEQLTQERELLSEEQKRLETLMRELERENEALKRTLGEAESRTQAREQAEYQKQITRFQQDKSRLEQDLAAARNENVSLKQTLTRGELEARSREQAEFKNRLERFQQEKSKLEHDLAIARGENAELSSKIKSLERIVQAHQENAERKSSTASKEAVELRAQLDHARTEQERLQKALKAERDELAQVQSGWSETQRILAETRNESEGLKRMLGEAQSSGERLREDMEVFQLEMEEKYKSQGLDLEEWKRKASDWNTSYARAVKENEALRAHKSEELETLRARNHQLSSQVEQAQRQIRDFTAQIEQQELIQKRMKLTSDLREHEGKLKDLVQKQQALEQDIRAREEALKSVLAEQEEAEREIVKAKQAQKYVVEQAKLKEKSRFPRGKAASGQDTDRAVSLTE